MLTRFQRYKKRSTAIITAVQYLDEPMAIIKMREFLAPQDLTILCGVLYVEPRLVARVGDYVVKNDDGTYNVMSQVDFKDTYEPI